MRKRKRSLTVNIILIFLIFNILSVMIFTVYMQKSSQNVAMKYAQSSLLEMTKEKGNLLAITFDRIQNRAEVMGVYMEEALSQDTSAALSRAILLCLTLRPCQMN